MMAFARPLAPVENCVTALTALAALAASAYDLPPCTVPLNLGVQMKTDTFNAETLREVRELGFRVVRRGLPAGPQAGALGRRLRGGFKQ